MSRGNTGSANAKLDPDERPQCKNAHRQEPVETSPTRAEEQRDEPRSERERSEEVQPRRLLFDALVQERDQHERGQKTEWQVDEKHPAPADAVNDESTHERSDQACDAPHAANHSLHASALRRSEDVTHDGECRGLHRAAAETLQRARRNQRMNATGKPAQNTREQEQRDTEQHHGLSAIQVRELAEDRNADGGDQDVCGENPGIQTDATQLADDGGHGGRDDRHLHRTHEHGQHQRDDRERSVQRALGHAAGSLDGPAAIASPNRNQRRITRGTTRCGTFCHAVGRRGSPSGSTSEPTKSACSYTLPMLLAMLSRSVVADDAVAGRLVELDGDADRELRVALEAQAVALVERTEVRAVAEHRLLDVALLLRRSSEAATSSRRWRAARAPAPSPPVPRPSVGFLGHARRRARPRLRCLSGTWTRNSTSAPLCERALVVLGLRAALRGDALHDVALALGGERRALALVVEVELLAPAAARCVFGPVLDRRSCSCPGG